MHPSSYSRMKWFVDNWLQPSRLNSTFGKSHLRILDVGSYDVNGSYKTLFTSPTFEYTGLDMESGPNVDIVPATPYCWSEIEDDSFDIVISGQVIEHVEFFWLTMSEIVRVAKEGALICLIAPRGFDQHRYPVDCYRFLADGMVALARYTKLDVLHAHCDAMPTEALNQDKWHHPEKEDSLLVARKPYSGPTQVIDPKTYFCVPSDLDKLQSPLVQHSCLVENKNIDKEEMQDITVERNYSLFYRRLKNLLLGRQND